MDFDLKAFLADLAPVMQKHGIKSMGGLAAVDGKNQIWKLIDPTDTVSAETVTALYSVLERVLDTVAGDAVQRQPTVMITDNFDVKN